MKKRLLILLLLSLVATVSADTFIFRPDIDGYALQATDGNYAAMRDGAGESTLSGSSTVVSAFYIAAAATGTNWNSMRRGILAFNTSNIPDDAIITSGIFSIYGTSKSSGVGSPDIVITGGILASNTSLANGDYGGFSSTIYANNITYAGYSDAGRNNWTLNANGLLAVSKKYSTVIFIRDSWDIDNSFTGTYVNGASTYITWRPVGYATESQRPFLEVVYTPAAGGDTTPPNSITGLSTSLIDCNKTAINWTNPTSADYYRLNVWRNGTFLYNLSNTTTSDYWTGLPNNTAMMFNSTTEDLTGNRNTTHWQNISWTTLSCPAVAPTPTPTPTPTPAPILAGCSYFNLTNVTFGINSTDWTTTEGLTTWGISTINLTQGNVSWWMCKATPTPTVTPTWQPQINPSTDRKIEWTLKGIWYYLFGA